MCLGFVAAVSVICVLLRLLRLLFSFVFFLAKSRRRRRRLLPRLCLAAAHFAREENALLRQLWERCQSQSKPQNEENFERNLKKSAAQRALKELSKAAQELCCESLAWHLAKALKFFDDSEVSRGLAAATRHLGRVESEDFAVSRSKAFLGAFDFLLEEALMEEKDFKNRVEFDAFFEVQRFGYAAALLGVAFPPPQAVTLSPLEAPRRAGEAFQRALGEAEKKEKEEKEEEDEEKDEREEDKEQEDEESARGSRPSVAALCSACSAALFVFAQSPLAPFLSQIDVSPGRGALGALEALRCAGAFEDSAGKGTEEMRRSLYRDVL